MEVSRISTLNQNSKHYTRFHSDNTNPWMQIPKNLFSTTFSVDSIFFPNLSIDNISLRKLPIFYQEMVKSWIAISQSNPHSISLILSQSLWYNSFIKIDSKPLSPSFLCLKQPLFLKDIFDTNGAFLAWDAFAHKFNLTQDFYFKWFQIKTSIPKSWLKIIRDNKKNITI